MTTTALMDINRRFVAIKRESGHVIGRSGATRYQEERGISPGRAD